MVDKKKNGLKALFDMSKSMPKPDPIFQKLAGTAAMMESIAKVNSHNIGTLMKAVDMSSTRALFKALPLNPSFSQFETGIGSKMNALKEHQTLLRQIAPMTENLKYFDVLPKYLKSTASLRLKLDADRALLPTILIDTPKIGTALNLREFTQYVRLFHKISASSNFGIGQTISKDLSKISIRLADQFEAMQTDGPARIEHGLVGNIEELLSSSLKIQEASFKEQGQAKESASAEALFQRRMTYFNALITILTFFWVIAVNLEERFTTENKEGQRQTEWVEMHDTIEEMAAQMDTIREDQEIEANRAAAADASLIGQLESQKNLEQISNSRKDVSDAKIIEILCEIARILKEQSTDKDEREEIR